MTANPFQPSAGMTDTVTWQSDFQQDMQRHYPPLDRWRFGNGLKYPVLSWQRRLRWLEHAQRDASKNPIRRLVFMLVKFRHQRDSVRLGFSIPLHAFGPGLSIAHWGTIAVDNKARVGGDCRIHQGVTIGSSKDRSPVLGNNVFIGANATIIGGVVLGNDVNVGANALVNRSFPDGAVLVGVPAVDIKATGAAAAE